MKSRFVFSFKMTGLLTGLLTWGWRGMLIGFLLGYLLDKRLKPLFSAAGQPPYGKRYRSRDEQLFFQLTFQMLGYLAKADGQVSQQEIHTTEQIMSAMALTAEERLAAIEAFNAGKTQPQPPKHLFKRFRKHFRQRTGKKLEWLHYQFQLLYAEGQANIQLVEILGMSAFHIGISPEQFQSLRQQYRKAWQDNRQHYRHQEPHQNRKQWHGQESTQHRDQQRSRYQQSYYRQSADPARELQRAYQLLGVTADTDLAGLKKAFRQKISRVHPDKLSGQQASEQQLAQAKEQSQQLQAAYQLIKKSRRG